MNSVVSYGALPPRDTSRDITAVELSSLSSVHALFVTNMEDGFDKERFKQGTYGDMSRLNRGTCLHLCITIGMTKKVAG